MLRYHINPAFYDFDWMGVISNLSYVRWLEDIRTRLLDISPYPITRLINENISPALFTTQVDYLNPYIGKNGGALEVHVIAGEKMGRTRWELIYDFYNSESDQHLVHARQLGCFVSLPSVRPVRIPPELAGYLSDRLSPTTDFTLE